MNVKLTLLFAIIASIEFVNSVPLLDDLTGGRNSDSGRQESNPNGLLRGLKDPVDPILCGLGLGLNSNDGALVGLKPITDGLVSSVGLGDGCNGNNNNRHGGSTKRCDRDGGNKDKKDVEVRGTINDSGNECE